MLSKRLKKDLKNLNKNEQVVSVKIFEDNLKIIIEMQDKEEP